MTPKPLTLKELVREVDEESLVCEINAHIVTYKDIFLANQAVYFAFCACHNHIKAGTIDNIRKYFNKSTGWEVKECKVACFTCGTMPGIKLSPAKLTFWDKLFRRVK